MQGVRADWGVELAVIEPGSFLVQRPQPLLLAVAGLVLLVLRHLHADTLCQGTDGIRVAQALNFHLKIDDTAALMTTEAIVDALVGGYGEGGGFLPVEGAQAEQVGTGTLQVHILPDHVFNWIPGG